MEDAEEVKKAAPLEVDPETAMLLNILNGGELYGWDNICPLLS